MAKTFKRYVLYVAQDVHDQAIFCPGSRKMISLINPIKEDVHVQSVDVLFEKGLLDELPSWLQGTPTLVCTSTRVAYTGSEAIRKIEEELHGGQQRQAARASEQSEIMGAPPSGERFDVGWGEEEEGSMGGGIASDATRIMSDDKKVSEEDVQRYMAQRNASLSQGASPSA